LKKTTDHLERTALAIWRKPDQMIEVAVTDSAAVEEIVREIQKREGVDVRR
jgi:hypothetical protein